MKSWKKLLPSIGILIFGLLYVYASSLYAGGSQENPEALGFDWIHNYWCDLLPLIATNGMENPAMPYAIAATVVLCASLAHFFYQFPDYFPNPPTWDKLIRRLGVLSMLIAVLVFTDLHDIVIPLSTLAALVALVGVFKGLIRHRARVHLYIGGFCTILMIANNYIYYTRQGLYYLPLLQKIGFVCVLAWVLAMNFSFLKIKK